MSAEEELAIIGMAIRTAGADDLEEFWRLVRNGEQALATTEHVSLPRAGLLADPTAFDAAHFAINGREAELMDPQHRLVLEACESAADDAVIDLRAYRGTVAVYAAGNLSAYRPQAMMSAGSPSEMFLAHIGNVPDCIASRVSYRFGFTGEAVSVQSACSSSLVAVHLARRALLSGDADLAVVVGVSLSTPAEFTWRSPAYSADGECAPFAERASGMVEGEGVCAILVKRLADAYRDSDPIWSVLESSAVNNDGANRLGFAAPSPDGQAAVITEAYTRLARPGRPQYVEAHGTGTVLGDQVELEALRRVYQADGKTNHRIVVGSVKPNIGHLVQASGLAGLIKASLCLDRQTLPPMANEGSDGPRAVGSGFEVLAQAQAWPGDIIRRAAVSSFGIGGTNSHVILREAPRRGVSPECGKAHILRLSARDDNEANRHQAALSQWIAAHPGVPICDIARSLAARPVHRGPARVATATTTSELLQVLTQEGPAAAIGLADLPDAVNHHSDCGHRIHIPTRRLSRPVQPGGRQGTARVDDSSASRQPDLGSAERQKPVPGENRAEPSTGGDADPYEVISRAVSGLLGSPVGLRDSLTEAGADSLVLLDLLSTVEGELGIRLPLRAALEADTIEELASLCPPVTGDTVG
jgi:acyl transferase domain-containing protein